MRACPKSRRAPGESLRTASARSSSCWWSRWKHWDRRVLFQVQSRLNIAASEGRGEELICSLPSSLERDVGGVTAIVAAPAKSAAATAIFKHVDIESTASLDLRCLLCMLERTWEEDLLADV